MATWRFPLQVGFPDYNFIFVVMNSELGWDKSSCLPIQVIYFCHMYMIVPYSNHQTDSRAKSYQHLLMWVWKCHKQSCLSHILIVTPKLLLLYPLQSRIWPVSSWGRPRFRGGFQQYGTDLRGRRDVRHRRHAVAGVGVWPGEWSCCGHNGGEMGVSPYFWMVYQYVPHKAVAEVSKIGNL